MRTHAQGIYTIERATANEILAPQASHAEINDTHSNRGPCVAFVLVAAAPLPAATVWNESINGDISNNRLAPTSVTLAPGSNDVIGSVQGSPSDIDYLTINVPSGDELSQIILESFTSTDQKGFIGVQSGTTFTQPPTGTDVTQLLGYTHFGPGAGNVGENILPSMGIGAAPGIHRAVGGRALHVLDSTTRRTDELRLQLRRSTGARAHNLGLGRAGRWPVGTRGSAAANKFVTTTSACNDRDSTGAGS